MENKQRIAAAIAAQTGLEADQLKDWLETPPDPAMGDYAFPCFRLAKTMRKAPPAIAAELAGSIGHIDGIASMDAKGGYLNFFADKAFAVFLAEPVADFGAVALALLKEEPLATESAAGAVKAFDAAVTRLLDASVSWVVERATGALPAAAR